VKLPYGAHIGPLAQGEDPEMALINWDTSPLYLPWENEDIYEFSV